MTEDPQPTARAIDRESLKSAPSAEVITKVTALVRDLLAAAFPGFAGMALLVAVDETPEGLEPPKGGLAKSVHVLRTGMFESDYVLGSSFRAMGAQLSEENE